MEPKKIKEIRIMMCEPVPGPVMPVHITWAQKTVELVARPGTTLDCTGLKEGSMSPLSPYEESYNAMQMIQRAYEAEKRGYDAFIIGCSSDMGLRECRSLVNIPVIAPTESAAIIASTLGNKFSAIDLQLYTIHVIENAVRNAGLTQKLASVRSHEEITAARDGDEKKLAGLLTAEMARAVDEDGAEAVFVSCTPTSSMLFVQGVREIKGVPVVDLLSASIKLAEMMVDLKRTCGTGVCKKSIYLAPSSGWEEQIPIKYD